MTQTKMSVSHRVLLVDDDEAVRTMMSATLERKGFEVVNLSALDFSLLLPDVMTIADEVDSQLTQAMDSYMNVVLKPVAA
jgi:CheY-like chemotaxis protein